ncbi:hypothetical protein E2C01_038071 [Portunus trituberculatus]|uniref:Uncharacterized protein n=1 Tax=Portunus trituberculatus TaxID=210409 RepID=A0A5B7FHJ2_PORTR|nr:hypothetical protein [Portunus trituberculatus]
MVMVNIGRTSALVSLHASHTLLPSRLANAVYYRVFVVDLRIFLLAALCHLVPISFLVI